MFLQIITSSFVKKVEIGNHVLKLTRDYNEEM